MPSDGYFIKDLLEIASSETERRKAAATVTKIAPDYDTKWPRNCCALMQSTLLRMAGIDVPVIAGAGAFANKLGGPYGSRGWTHIRVGDQRPGDIGVCYDWDDKVAGADHVYLVVQTIDANQMVVVDNQWTIRHLRCADGSDVGDGGKTPTDYFLRAPGYDPAVIAGPAASIASAMPPAAFDSSGPPPRTAILTTAAQSRLASHQWGHRQGVMPIGYTKGMALAYARVLCKLRKGASEAVAMAVAPSNDTKFDALAFYRGHFEAAGLSGTPKQGEDTLRALFVLLFGLGVMESSGRYFCGRDRSAHFTAADTAEAGLFQTSYGASNASSSMRALVSAYAGRSDFLDVFSEGCPPPDKDNLEIFGTGPGADFQKLTKSCPAFAVEYAALCLRVHRGEFGTVRDQKVEIVADCDQLFRDVAAVVDRAGLTEI